MMLTVTTKLHAARFASPSMAVHVTAVDPPGNADQAAGVQVTVIGDFPVTEDTANGTATGLPSGEFTVTDAGHAIVGSADGDGVAVPPPHADASTPTASDMTNTRLFKFDADLTTQTTIVVGTRGL